MHTLPPTIEMERAYLSKDASYNGLFFFGVRTTGIFCRPTCPARKPLPQNVEYFATAEEALTGGYRPCKRCRPLEDDGQPAWVAALLCELGRDPAARISETDLRARGVDPATVRRYFQRRFGMTFQAYARARRLSESLNHLHTPRSIDSAVLASGYESHSGFREAFARLFGGTPGQSRAGQCVCVGWFPSPLGPLVAGATEEGVCLLEFSEPQRLELQFTALRKCFGMPIVPASHPHLDSLRCELASYFAGSLRTFSTPLHLRGTAFQCRVWNELLQIPYGKTRSYEGLATAIGAPHASRAVGRANGQNRIAIVIPCHRVVNKSGALGGYGGGLRRKEFLLELERRP